MVGKRKRSTGREPHTNGSRKHSAGLCHALCHGTSAVTGGPAPGCSTGKRAARASQGLREGAAHRPAPASALHPRGQCHQQAPCDSPSPSAAQPAPAGSVAARGGGAGSSPGTTGSRSCRPGRAVAPGLLAPALGHRQHGGPCHTAGEALPPAAPPPEATTPTQRIKSPSCLLCTPGRLSPKAAGRQLTPRQEWDEPLTCWL